VYKASITAQLASAGPGYVSKPKSLSSAREGEHVSATYLAVSSLVCTT